MLAMQTGLLEIQMDERMGAMSVILYIVLASLFQTLVEVTHPVLLAVGGQPNGIASHAKVLLLCLFLFYVPTYMSYLLVQAIDLDLWTMVVISSSLITSIQVIG